MKILDDIPMKDDERLKLFRENNTISDIYPSIWGLGAWWPKGNRWMLVQEYNKGTAIFYNESGLFVSVKNNVVVKVKEFKCKKLSYCEEKDVILVKYHEPDEDSNGIALLDTEDFDCICYL